MVLHVIVRITHMSVVMFRNHEMWGHRCKNSCVICCHRKMWSHLQSFWHLVTLWLFLAPEPLAWMCVVALRHRESMDDQLLFVAGCLRSHVGWIQLTMIGQAVEEKSFSMLVSFLSLPLLGWVKHRYATTHFHRCVGKDLSKICRISLERVTIPLYRVSPT